MKTQPAAQKYLLSNTLCETVGTVKLTWTGADAVTYKLGDKTVEYAYTLKAKTPDYCKYTVGSHTIPADLKTHVAHSTGKFTLTKVEGPGKLTNSGTAWKLLAYANTLHGSKISAANEFFEKKLTITDPCAKLAFTTTAVPEKKYQIGTAQLTLVTAKNQISQSGASTAFCLKRVGQKYTFDPVGNSKWFNKDHDSTGILSHISGSPTKDTKTTVTITYHLDTNTAMQPAKSLSFIVYARDACYFSTFTTAVKQVNIPTMYEGRDQSVTFP